MGNYKKALHETEKVLKKTPQLRCARALKGLSLVHLGRVQESKSIIDDVVNEKPSDDSTLQVLSFIFKELDQCTGSRRSLFIWGSLLMSLNPFFCFRSEHLYHLQKCCGKRWRQ